MIDDTVTPASAEWLVWQLVDSAFPTGGFAHSLGLESARQHCEVPDADALARYIEASVLQAATTTMPVVNAAYDAPDRWAELDALLDAFLTNPIANRASRVQGRTLFAGARRIWPEGLVPPTPGVHRSLAHHVAPVTGVVFRALGVDRTTAQRAVLFGAARTVTSAAVRLGIVGSYEAQRLQSAAAPAMERMLVRYRDADERALAQTSPIIDILQGGHDRLYSRLFQS